MNFRNDDHLRIKQEEFLRRGGRYEKKQRQQEERLANDENINKSVRDKTERISRHPNNIGNEFHSHYTTHNDETKFLGAKSTMNLLSGTNGQSKSWEVAGMNTKVQERKSKFQLGNQKHFPVVEPAPARQGKSDQRVYCF